MKRCGVILMLELPSFPLLNRSALINTLSYVDPAAVAKLWACCLKSFHRVRLLTLGLWHRNSFKFQRLVVSWSAVMFERSKRKLRNIEIDHIEQRKAVAKTKLDGPDGEERCKRQVRKLVTLWRWVQQYIVAHTSAKVLSINRKPIPSAGLPLVDNSSWEPEILHCSCEKLVSFAGKHIALIQWEIHVCPDHHYFQAAEYEHGVAALDIIHPRGPRPESAFTLIPLVFLWPL